MKTDGIILDVDGTLWDTTGLCADAWNAAILAGGGFNAGLCADRLKKLFGKPMNVIFANVFPELAPEKRDELSRLCCKYESEYLRSRTVPPYEGVPETMCFLSERTRLFIVSNCQKGYIEEFLDNTGLGGCVSGFLCYGDTLAPKGETIRLLVKKYGLKAPVYVGDTVGDAEACETAGVPFIFAAYGFGSEKTAEASSCVGTINSFAGLRDIIEF